MRIYTVTFDVTAVTAQVDLFELTPADDKPLTIERMILGQTTELGDAAEEQFEIEVHRGGTAMTSGSGGSAATPEPIDPHDAAAGFTAEVLNTTLATFTSGVVVHRDPWNVRVPFDWVPLPEHRIEVSQGQGGLAIRIGAAPADSISIFGTLYVGEA